MTREHRRNTTPNASSREGPRSCTKNAASSNQDANVGGRLGHATLRRFAVCTDRSCASLRAFAIRRTATVRANRETTHSAWLPTTPASVWLPDLAATGATRPRVNEIDQAQFQFNATAGLIVALMVSFLVFAVSLDSTWEQFRSVARNPKAAVVGLIGQFGILPAGAFLVGRYLIDTPSVAMGLLLVACCPSGALSNLSHRGGQGGVSPCR